MRVDELLRMFDLGEKPRLCLLHFKSRSSQPLTAVVSKVGGVSEEASFVSLEGCDRLELQLWSILVKSSYFLDKLVDVDFFFNFEAQERIFCVVVVLLLDADDFFHRHRVDEADREDLRQAVQGVDEGAGFLGSAELALFAAHERLPLAMLRVVQIAQIVADRQQWDLPLRLDPEIVEETLLRKTHIRVHQPIFIVFFSKILANFFGFFQVESVKV